MEYRKAKNMIDKILKENPVEIGIFISMLCYEYTKLYDIDDKHFFNSLKNSLKILKEDETINENFRRNKEQ